MPRSNQPSTIDDFDPDAPMVSTADDEEDAVLNLEDVDENAQIRPLPPGIYDAIVESAEFGRSQRSNNPMLTWRIRVQFEDDNGEHRERVVFLHTVINQENLPRFKRTLIRVAPDADLSAIRPSQVDSIVAGRRCRVNLQTRTFEGQLRNNVRDVLPPAEAAESFLDS